MGRKELDARFAAEQLAIKNQKDQFETMATARQSALDQRQKQFIDKLKNDQKRDADADKRHLAILERIKGRREGHIKLNATTKGAMELTHAAMEKTIKATSAKSDKVLAEATKKAKEAVAGVKADFDAKHVSLKSEHDALDQKVKEGKEETDKNLAEAKTEAKDETQQLRKNLKPRSRSKVPNSPNSLAIMTPTTRSPRSTFFIMTTQKTGRVYPRNRKKDMVS